MRRYFPRAQFIIQIESNMGVYMAEILYNSVRAAAGAPIIKQVSMKNNLQGLFTTDHVLFSGVLLLSQQIKERCLGYTTLWVGSAFNQGAVKTKICLQLKSIQELALKYRIGEVKKRGKITGKGKFGTQADDLGLALLIQSEWIAEYESQQPYHERA